jgi:RHS repeat-associated protein
VIYSGVNVAYNDFDEPSNQTDSDPTAHLNYTLFDKDYNVLKMDWQVVPANANLSKQKVSLNGINIKEAGYMYVYLSYEGQGVNWVYFDDFKITHTKTNVVQYNEYYPFGLQAGTSWTRDNSTNNFLYNEGSELNTATGWYDLPYRNYDPVLGRFVQVDPLAYQQHDMSAYQYAGDSPTFYNDPSGLTFTGTGAGRPGWLNDLVNEFGIEVVDAPEYSENGASNSGYWKPIYNLAQFKSNKATASFNFEIIRYKYVAGTSEEEQTQEEPSAATSYRWFDYGSDSRAAVITNIPFVIMVSQGFKTRPAEMTVLVTVMIQMPKSVAISEDDYNKREYISLNEASDIATQSILTAHTITIMSTRTTDGFGLQSLFERSFIRNLEGQLSIRVPGVDILGVPGSRVISR